MSTASVDIIAQAIRVFGDEAASAQAEHVLKALNEAGYAIRKKPQRKTATESADVFSPNTGNDALDAFLRRKHRPDWQARLKKAKVKNRPGMLSIPAPQIGYPPRPMMQSERVRLYRDFEVVQTTTD